MKNKILKIKAVLQKNLEELVEEVESSILAGNFEIVDNEFGGVDLSARTIKVKVGGMIFEIWNANTPDSTYIYSLQIGYRENAIFVSFKEKGQFKNPALVRGKIIGDNVEAIKRDLKNKIDECQDKLSQFEKL
jgi:hypothetical protein